MSSFIDLLREDKKITIFLGAGSSVSAGFPTDTELRNKIAESMLNENLYQIFEQAGFTIEDCKEFRTRLVKGGFTTIDELINTHNQYAPLAKLAIAFTLLQYEYNGIANEKITSDEHWYMPFFRAIVQAGLERKLNNITFITLNYDRTLQQFIHEFTTNRGITYDPYIINLHGRLPFLPFENKSYSVEYGDTNHLGHEYKNFTSSIFSLSDYSESSEAYKEATDEIRRSDLLLIMGFAYHEPILEKLNLSNIPMNFKCDIFGLIYLVKDSTINNLEQFNLLKKEMKCIDFVKDLSIPLSKLIWKSDTKRKLERQNRLTNLRDSINYDPFAESKW